MQEWQARQRERTKEWHAYRQKEEAEEERITNEYREIGMRLKAYPQEEVCKARILVSSFIRAGADIEEVTKHLTMPSSRFSITCFSPFIFMVQQLTVVWVNYDK